MVRLFFKRIFQCSVMSFWFAMLFSLSVSAEHDLPQNYLTDQNKTQFFEGFSPSIKVLSSDEDLNRDEVRSQFYQVSRVTEGTPNFGFTNSYYWLGWTLQNSTGVRKDLYLEVAYSMLDSVEVEVRDVATGSFLVSYKGGDKYPFYQRPVLHPNFVFQVEIQPSQNVEFLVKSKTTSSSQFPIILWSQDGMASYSQNHAAFIGSLVGIIIVLAIYNLFLFISLRDITYLFLFLTLLGYAGVEGCITGFAYYYVWPNSPEWNDVSLTVLSNFGLANLCFFSISFFNLQQVSPRFYRWVNVSGFIGYALCLVSFIVPYQHIIQITAVNVVYSPVLTYLAGLYLMFKGYKQAYFYNGAFFVFVIAASYFVLGKFGLVARNGLSEYSIHIGATMTVVMLSFALADSIKRERNEKEEAQEHAIANLEKYRSIYEGSLEGMFRVASNGKMLACNPAFANLMGVATEKALMENLGKVTEYIPASAVDLNNIMEMIGRDGHVFGYETLCRRIDGSEFWGAIYAKFIHDPVHGRFIDASIVDITDKKQNEEKLNFIANHDLLTGLSNRVGFQQDLKSAVQVAYDTSSKHSLIFMDLDQFKIVNDTSGHSAGDELLKQLSTLFRKHVRDVDAIARLGGDEFAILLFDCSLSLASDISNRLRQEVSDYRFYWEDKVFSVGVSIGIVPVDGKIKSVENLMSLADTACYAAKDAGRNRVVVHKEENTDIPARQTEMSLAQSVKEAIDNDSLMLYKQNIVSLGEATNGDQYEILVRLQGNDGVLLPGGFLPAAERFDAIEKLDYWVTNAYFKWLSEHPKALERLHIANINISGRTLSNDDFGEYLLGLFSNYKIPKSKICFEITESAAISNLAHTSSFINRMKKNGFQFSLDDFGSGFSSYSYLKMLPVASLKIDGSFVKNLVDDPVDHAMVKSIIEVAHIMELKVTAEFVESEEVLQELRALGVDCVQGYHVHVPEPLA